jgi:SAM-dependent methyltransferase
MTGVGDTRVTPDWLALREPADAAARATELLAHLPAGPHVVHDLGCGTGAMGRWLAPRLAGPQHWVMYDRDADLLPLAAAGMPAHAADGAPVTVETRRRDITRLDDADLAGATLVTASALLDMFTADELDRFVAACAKAGAPVLLTLSVIGRAELSPAHPLDAEIAGAFNDHQRRDHGGRRLLGPDAVGRAAEAFAARGADILVRPSVWRLGPTDAALTSEWLAGWIGAAAEQRPITGVDAYAVRRSAEAAAGRLRVTLHHADLLARPS